MQATNFESNAGTRASGTLRQSAGSPLVPALGALLVLQLLAALALGLGGRDMEPATSGGPLVDFERDRVTGIRIQVQDAEPALVVKTQNGWIIPALGDLPAAERKVTELLSKVEGLEKGLPVATSAQALKRFKVAEDGFERKLTLESGDGTLATLYLGDSAGFRRLFVRADGDGSVYEAELGLFDAPDKSEDWSDRTLLHLDAEGIQRLAIAGMTLERTDKGWRLTDLAEGEEQDPQSIEDLVRRLTSIDFLGVLAGDEPPAVIQDPPPVEITAALESGDNIEYRISKLEEGDDYLLEASNRPQGFRLAAYVAEDLAGIGRAEATPQSTADQVPHTSEVPVSAVSPSGTQAPLPTPGKPAETDARSQGEAGRATVEPDESSSEE